MLLFGLLLYAKTDSSFHIACFYMQYYYYRFRESK